MRAVFIAVYVVTLVATASAGPQPSITIQITGPSRLVIGGKTSNGTPGGGYEDNSARIEAILEAVNHNGRETRGYLDSMKQSLESIATMLVQYMQMGVGHIIDPVRRIGYPSNNTRYPDNSTMREGSSNSSSWFSSNSSSWFRSNSPSPTLSCHYFYYTYEENARIINDDGMNATCKNGTWIVDQCPEHEGFFMQVIPVPGNSSQSQCFKIMPGGARSSMGDWRYADRLCKQAGLVLPKPRDPVALRNILYKNNPGDWPYWVGAYGKGASIVWKRGREVLDPGLLIPGAAVYSSHCLALLVTPDAMRRYPETPYTSYYCSRSYTYTLCERLME